jgi:hypothetical protein
MEALPQIWNKLTIQMGKAGGSSCQKFKCHSAICALQELSRMPAMFSILVRALGYQVCNIHRFISLVLLIVCKVYFGKKVIEKNMWFQNIQGCG